MSGTVQNDILKEYVARGTYIYPPRASMRIVTDLFAYCARELPNWNTISISGYHIREAGSTAVQEVAFTLAHASAYVQAAIDAGLDVNQFGQRISFFFNAHNDFLEEIAKYRAARRLWARLMRDRFGATNPRAQQLRFHTQTAGSTLTAQQPDNNIVRVAIQAMAAVLGGTQSLHCNGRDEALSLPSEESARIALRTQQIIAAETGAANTVDPVGGSFAIEKLTDDIEHGVEDILSRIERMGGTMAAIESRLHSARDPGVRVPRAGGHRLGNGCRGRRESVCGTRCSRRRGRYFSSIRKSSDDRSNGSGRFARTRAPDAMAPGAGGGLRVGARRRQPRAAHHRRRGSARDRRRDRGRHANASSGNTKRASRSSSWTLCRPIACLKSHT